MEPIPIQVFLRVKPGKAIFAHNNTSLNIPSRPSKSFSFDCILGDTQEDVFEECRDHVADVLDGFNVSIFA